MRRCYFDTSALVKRYATEPGTPTVDAIIESEDTEVVITSLAVVEATSAARRKYNRGTFSEDDVDAFLTALYREALSSFTVVPMDERAMARSFDLVLEHDLRTLDALQLSSALVLSESRADVEFISADADLLGVARSLGLVTLDPAADPE